MARLPGPPAVPRRSCRQPAAAAAPCGRPSAGTPPRRSDDAEFAALQDQCIRDVVAMQEEVGLQVVTDGEFRRGSYWGRFVERTQGFEIKPASFKFRDDQRPRGRFHRALCQGARSRARSRSRSTNSCSCAASPR